MVAIKKVGDRKLLETEAIDASKLVFEVVSPPNLDDIYNIDPFEKTFYSNIIAISQKIESLLFNYSNIDFTDLTYKKFEKSMWAYLQELHESEIKCQNEKITSKLKKSFRGRIHQYITQSFICSRGFAKPFGYPGDYKMMQYLYDNIVVSETTIGKYLDAFFLNDPLAKAVVNRVKTMSKTLLEFIVNSRKNSIHVLNIASGPGFDLLNIAKHSHSKSVTIHCFDQEIDSLSYIKEKLSQLNVNTTFKFYKADIKSFFKNWKSEIKFDYIYNIGLADYLPDRILKNLMQESVNNLCLGGRLVIAHKDYKKFPEYHPSWLYDWNFFHRDFKESLAFVRENLENYSENRYFYESEKAIVYFHELVK